MPHETGIEPLYCRLEAFRLFQEQLTEIHTTTGLVRAVTAVSMHALDDVTIEQVETEIQNLAQRVISHCPSGLPAARLAHLHDVLFDEDHFIGNLDNYYLALNSYLPAVLHTRRGLPILLALLYKAVGEQVGLTIEGINSPGHFLARVQTDEGWLIIDPFYNGQALSVVEAFRRIEQVAGRAIPRDEMYLTPATHVQWLSRIIGNLQALFAKEGRLDDLGAMTELQQILAEYSTTRV
jgi:regulator of sirC expression with transglutaminase-like and TPR domain